MLNERVLNEHVVNTVLSLFYCRLNFFFKSRALRIGLIETTCIQYMFDNYEMTFTFYFPYTANILHCNAANITISFNSHTSYTRRNPICYTYNVSLADGLFLSRKHIYCTLHRFIYYLPVHRWYTFNEID